MCGTVTITKTRQEMEKEKQCLMDQLPAKGLGGLDVIHRSSHHILCFLNSLSSAAADVYLPEDCLTAHVSFLITNINTPPFSFASLL